MVSFGNPVVYALTILNLVGALATAGVMLWGTRNAIPTLRPFYAAMGALCTAFAFAHIFLLFDIDNQVWSEYIQFLRMASWPLICMPPILGTKWVTKRSHGLNELARRIEETP